MADFIHKKLQVFVSSTYEDLKPERQAAVSAILTAGHIPAGMELFTAGDESQMDVIKQWIDESDVYMLILGGRYGSIEPNSGKSYTQLEYEYAVSLNKPLFACIVSDSAHVARVKEHGPSVSENENPKELKAFQTEVLSKMSKFWDDEKDIKIAVAETLAQFARRDELVGWIRPSNQSNLPALSDELARLSKENSELRSQIAASQSNETFGGIFFSEMMGLLESRPGLFDFLYDRRFKIPFFSANDVNSPDSQDYLDELVLRGLVTVSIKRGGSPFFIESRTYDLSDTGRAFLNKAESSSLENSGN